MSGVRYGNASVELEFKKIQENQSSIVKYQDREQEPDETMSLDGKTMA